MPPPSKRQKRNIISSSPSNSSDQDDASHNVHNTIPVDTISSPVSIVNESPSSLRSFMSNTLLTPTKSLSKARTANHPHNAAPIRLPNRNTTENRGNKSASTSPEKPKGRAKASEKGKSGDLFKLFSSQIQRQRASTNGNNVPNLPTNTRPQVQEEEVETSISDDDDVGDGNAQPKSIVSAAAKKRANVIAFGSTDGISSSQKFLRKPVSNHNVQKKEDDMRPWAERFAPVNLDELAVHKKKVSDVRGWLESVFDGRIRQRLLVLKGAAGTGKTTTVELLAKSMDCDILEWRNPGGTVNSSEGFVSMAAQFEEFMGRGRIFGQLDMFSEAITAPAEPTIKPLDRRKSILLVEEFPNTFTRSSSALQSFKSSILQYLASNTPSLSMMYYKSTNISQITPLIMVVSETLLTTSTASADSFTAHRLLGSEVLQHPGVSVIEFNAIAPTLLTKALELVVLKESRKSGRRNTPGPLVLKKLGEIGDVRSAIGSLEFLCVRGDESGGWGAKVSFGKSKKSGKGTVPMTKMEEESLELVTRREASLGIFHAVGKVVYNKRDDLPQILGDETSPESLPDYLSDKARLKRSQVSVDQLIDETGTDTQTFVAALHENYILSCDAPPNSFEFSDLDHVNGCLDGLSDSDLVCPDGNIASGFRGFRSGSGADILRQDELCFQIAVRGILFSLPNPVKRRVPAANGLRQGKGGDAFKMFYPTSLKLWRMKEEIESLIDLWTTKLMKGEDYSESKFTSRASMFTKPKPGSVESWRSSRVTDISANEASGEDDNATPLLGIGASAKKEMLLERLPYMAIMAKGRNGGSMPLALKDLERVTMFTGIGGPSDDNMDEGEDGSVTEEWATDKPVDIESPQKKAVGNRWIRKSRPSGLGLETRFDEQKLVLSDDDIEDFE